MTRFNRLIAVSACVVPLGAAHAGLINPASTVSPFYNFVDAANVAQSAPSTHFATGTPAPFSLAAPLTDGFNVSADTHIFVTNTTVTIQNNFQTAPFCLNNATTGPACTDPPQTFDFKFTNEAITGVSVDPASSALFRPATFGTHTGLTRAGPNEIIVDVTGDAPGLTDSLIIDVSFAGNNGGNPMPEPATLAILGVAGAGVLGVRRRRD